MSLGIEYMTPLKGENTITLNEDTVILALEIYLRAMTKQPVKVQSATVFHGDDEKQIFAPKYDDLTLEIVFKPAGED